MTDFSETYVFQSTYAEVTQTLATLMEELRRVGVDAADMATVEIVLAEALNNVVEHAYAERPGNCVRLQCTLCEAGLCVEILDTGAAMPGGQVPSGKAPCVDADTDELPEGGFGWNMIHALTEHLTYRRSGTRNTTGFVIPLDGLR